MGQKVTIGCW